jgi:acetyl-CoA decarbonylase/synthase complex subunit epsilon
MMAANMTPGQTAEVAGPKKAFIIQRPEVASAMIKKAERPLLVVGSEASNIETKDGNLIDSVIRMKKAWGLTVVATGHMVGEFNKRGVAGVHSIPLMNLGDRLRDSEWSGLDGEGGYDFVIFAGISYYMEWLVLSGLKNFATGLTTISLDANYQPNAGWSLGTMPPKRWREVLDKLLTVLEGGR